MDTSDQEKIREMLKNAQNILIVPSAPIDGDSIGSALALTSVLKKMGKNVTVAATDAVPESLKFLPLVEQLQVGLQHSFNKDFVITLSTAHAEVDHLKYEVEPGKINIIVTPKDGTFSGHDLSFQGGEPSQNFDLIVTVDTGDLVQLGTVYSENKELFENTDVMNIDHHASNGKFGSHNFLDTNAAATTQILTPILFDLEKELREKNPNETLIDEDIATLLLVGIITDTGSFQHTNTSPEAFEVAADLLDRGARQQEIIKHIFKTKSLATLKLWGRVLSKIKFVPEAGLVYSTISLQDLQETGATPDDSGGIIDELMSNAPGAEVVMLLKEKEPGFISGSLRAPGQLADVSEVAQCFGGGGHKKAAGFRIRNKSLEETLLFTESAIANYMREKLAQQAPPSILTKSTDGDSFTPGRKIQPEKITNRLFPALVTKPPALVTKPQASIPKPSPGGEDMLLEDFRKRQATQTTTQDQNSNPNLQKEKEIEKKAAPFFQDPDGQAKPGQEHPPAQPQAKPGEPTVGDVLSQFGQN